MAKGRPQKEGLDFAGWEVGVLDNDTKMDRLIEAQGIAAFTVYFYLCQHAYSSHGYYLDWDYSCCATTARKLGKGASAEFVKNVVDMCLNCDLFDKQVFDAYGVLTSRGIQRRYWGATKSRVSNSTPKKFWLLKKGQGFDKHTQNSTEQPVNGIFCDGKSTDSTEQNITEQNITLHYSSTDGNGPTTETQSQPPTLEEIEAYCKKRNSNIDPKRFYNYYTANGWVFSSGVPIADWRIQIQNWEKNERPARQKAETNVEYEEMVAAYVPTYQKKGT